jgi:hypothetical protein
MHSEAQVGVTGWVRRDDKDLASDLLQNLELPYDEGAPADEETAFVLSAETARQAARHDRG